MKDWKERTLSKAGKEVLIKAVVQAIPTYTMNCFLLPITLCHDIEKATANFYWGGADDTRKFHWVGWDRLTKSKANGGLGFREIHHFNLALLAKQIWFLLNNPNSTSYKILKAKYFPHTSLLQAGLGYNPSFLWRSLWSSIPLVKAGLGWRVGNGRKIHIWEENWIGLVHPRKPSGDRNENLEIVADLIEAHNPAWNDDLLRENFSTDDINDILSIPLSNSLPDDRRIWRPTKNGNFSVRTAYHLAMQLFSKNFHLCASPSNQNDFWKKLWKIKLLPKVSNFIWHACNDSLPTTEKLVKRGLIIDPICTLCGEEPESLNHILLRCNLTRQAWTLSPLRVDHTLLNLPSFKFLLWNFMEAGNAEAIELFCYTAWSIWCERNKALFEETNFCHVMCIEKAQKLWMEATGARCKNVKKKENRENDCWQPPPHGSAKLNTDVAMLPNGQIGMGFILRNDMGNILRTGAKRMVVGGSSTILEGLALRYALQTLNTHTWPPILVESDSKILIDNLNGKADGEIYGDIITKDIQDLGKLLTVTSFKHIKREGNNAAHNIAKGPEFQCFNDFPMFLKL